LEPDFYFMKIDISCFFKPTSRKKRVFFYYCVVVIHLVDIIFGFFRKETFNG